jgi:hypothetical protein
MPWFRIPAENLAHLPLFGIDLIRDENGFAWYRGEVGRMRVEKRDPRVFLEDVGEAIQLGATAILLTEGDEIPKPTKTDKPN